MGKNVLMLNSLPLLNVKKFSFPMYLPYCRILGSLCKSSYCLVLFVVVVVVVVVGGGVVIVVVILGRTRECFAFTAFEHGGISNVPQLL